MTSPTDAPRPALGELARLAKAATPGPWKATSAFPIWRTIASLGSTETGAWWVAHDDAYAKHTNGAKADAEFIAACSPAVILQLVALASGGAEMREALEQIVKGEGRYSRDPLTHAENTIADMKALALAALTPERPADAD